MYAKKTQQNNTKFVTKSNKQKKENGEKRIDILINMQSLAKSEIKD